MCARVRLSQEKGKKEQKKKNKKPKKKKGQKEKVKEQEKEQEKKVQKKEKECWRAGELACVRTQWSRIVEKSVEKSRSVQFEQ